MKLFQFDDWTDEYVRCYIFSLFLGEKRSFLQLTLDFDYHSYKDDLPRFGFWRELSMEYENKYVTNITLKLFFVGIQFKFFGSKSDSIY